MNNNQTTWSIHDAQYFERPAHLFPGDETVEAPYAEAILYDPKQNNYPRRTITGVLKVAQRYGAGIDLETYERTRRMVAAPEAADPYIDGGGAKAEERRRRFGLIYDSVREAFSGNTTSDSLTQLGREDRLLGALMRYWGNSMQALPTETRNTIEQHALQTLRFSLAKAEAPNMSSYTEHAFWEALCYGRLWIDTVWSGQPPDKANQKKRFARWVACGMVGITKIDSAVDLGRDYQEGNVQFKPPILGRAALLCAGIAYLSVAVAPLVRWKIQSLLAPLPRRNKVASTI